MLLRGSGVCMFVQMRSDEVWMESVINRGGLSDGVFNRTCDPVQPQVWPRCGAPAPRCVITHPHGGKSAVPCMRTAAQGLGPFWDLSELRERGAVWSGGPPACGE